MKYFTSFFCSAAFTLLFTTSALAAATTAGFNVSRGQSDSMTYSLSIKQQYEPWIANDLFELAPLAEIGGHAWVSDSSDVDSVWGGFLAPGLRFTLNTGKEVQPYLEASVGGELNTDDDFDDRKLGSRALFRTRGSIGLAFGEGSRHRLQGDYIHQSTAGLTDNNAGYNSYGVSYGYSF